MRRGLILLAVVLGLCGPGVSAQQADPPRNPVSGELLSRKDYTDSLRKRLHAVLKLHGNGKKDTAYRGLDTIRAEVKAQQAFLDDHAAYWWPDLILARLKRRDRDNPAAEQAALPLVQALDTDKHRQGATRLEAMLILTQALYTQKKYGESHLIAQGLLRDAPEDFKPKWRLSAETYHAMAATRAGSPDAEALRAALLDGYLEREAVKVKDYLYIWRFDLKQRRADDSDVTRLLIDARMVYDFILTDERAQSLDLSGLEGDLARIFAEANDFKRAEPLLRKQLTLMEAGSVKYYWAWQNILAMNYRQKKYTGVMRDSALVLAQLEGQGDDYARVTSFIERHFGLAAGKLGESALYHEMMQRAYVSIRRVRSANHPDAIKVRARVELDQIDPEDFPYAEELGVATRDQGKLTIYADGSTVLREYMAGRALPLGRKLKSYVASNDTSAVGHLNLGLYHALNGEIGPSEEALERARALARSGTVKSLPANSPWFDLFTVITHNWARDWKPERAHGPIARLMARTDLTDDQLLTLHVLRFLLERAEDNFVGARAIYDAHLTDFDPRQDTSPWGVFRALSVVYPLFEVAPSDARAMVPKIEETLKAAGSPKLATVFLPVFRANSETGYTLVERNFQALAFQIKALSRMLPPDHQALVIARLTFVDGLWSRGNHQDALDLLNETIRIYRSSPWHRPDVVGTLDVWRAELHLALGNGDLAFAMLDQAYQAIDPDSYRPIYWMEILTFYALALYRADQIDAALAVTTAAMENQAMRDRLIPVDHSKFLRIHATVLEGAERHEEALEVLREAENVLPSTDYRGGFAHMQVNEDAAYINYEIGDYEAAYRAMTKASDFYFRAISESAGSDGNEVQRDRTREHGIVFRHAVYAWTLAQQLEEGE